jgi:hypothetical protein
MTFIGTEPTLYTHPHPLLYLYHQAISISRDTNHITWHHLANSLIAMDTFTTFEDIALLPHTDFPESTDCHNDDDIMQMLADADHKMGYGGYCIIS